LEEKIYDTDKVEHVLAKKWNLPQTLPRPSSLQKPLDLHSSEEYFHEISIPWIALDE